MLFCINLKFAEGRRENSHSGCCWLNENRRGREFFQKHSFFHIDWILNEWKSFFSSHNYRYMLAGVSSRHLIFILHSERQNNKKKKRTRWGCEGGKVFFMFSRWLYSSLPRIKILQIWTCLVLALSIFIAFHPYVAVAAKIKFNYSSRQQKNFRRSDVLVYVTLCTFIEKLLAGCMVHDAFFSFFPDNANAHFQFSLLIASCSRHQTCDGIIKERKRAAASDAYRMMPLSLAYLLP